MPTTKKEGRKLRDKKRLLRKENHLTRPPRLEGVAKNKMMNPTEKKKKSKILKEITK